MPHALLIAPRSLPRLNAGFHVALSSYPFNLSTNASVALSFSKTWSVDARRKLSTPGGLQDPGELEDLGERISRLAFRYDHAKRARANRNGRLASQEWQEQHARSKPLISGGINDKLGRLKEDGQKAEYSRVKALVENLVLVEGYKPDASIYQALILANANAEHGSTREISQWLQDMDKADVALDSGIYHAVLKALAVHPDQLLRDETLRNMRERWYSLTSDGHHYVAVGLIRERKLELAIDWLQQMREANVNIETWLYDLLIYGLCDVQEFDEALSILKYRINHEGRDSIATHGDHDLKEFVSTNVWYHFLDSASRAMHIEATTFVYNARVAPGYLNPSAGMCQNILICAARSGNTKLATSVFNVLTKRSGNPIQLHHFETLIEGYIGSGDLKTAMTLLSTAQQSGHTPVKGSTRPILLALRESRDHTQAALECLENLRDESRSVPLAALNLIIEAFVSLDDFEGALRAYNGLSTFDSPRPSDSPHRRLVPDTETFNLLLQGCYQVQDKTKATLLASEMVALKINPDPLTYDTLVRICVKCDTEMDDAWRYVLEARKMEFDVRKSTVEQLARIAPYESHGRAHVMDVPQKEAFERDVVL